MKRRNEGRELAVRAAHALERQRHDQAKDLARRAYQLSPRDAEVLSVLAEIAWAAGDPAATVTFLEAAARESEAPLSTARNRRLGEARFNLGKLDDAARAYRDVVAADPDDLEGWRGLARALQKLADIPGATTAWRRVLALAPGDWQAHNDLGAALMESRDWEGADAAFAAALATTPDEPLVMINRATLDLRCGRAAAAVPALQACLTSHGDFAPAHAGLGFALRELARYDEAAAAFRRAITLDPQDPVAACGLARTLLEAGAAQQALLAAQDFLRRRPGHAGALAVEAFARLALGDVASADRLLDYDRLLARVELPVPDGFPDIATFNQALAAHASSHRTLVVAPASHATAGGMHSGTLLVHPRGPVAGFERALRDAVGTYWRSLPDLPDHPFVGGRPHAGAFNIWCVVLGSGGHQTPHIHPEAWLSGVYYVQLPESVLSGEGPDGWLEFGVPDRPIPTQVEPKVVRLRPAEGLLVLFPSYFYHRTIPFTSAGTRISVAFDLVPVAG